MAIAIINIPLIFHSLFLFSIVNPGDNKTPVILKDYRGEISIPWYPSVCRIYRDHSTLPVNSGSANGELPSQPTFLFQRDAPGWYCTKFHCLFHQPRHLCAGAFPATYPILCMSFILTINLSISQIILIILVSDIHCNFSQKTTFYFLNFCLGFLLFSFLLTEGHPLHHFSL